MKILNFFFIITVLLTLASCKSKPAPIINNSKNIYSKNSFNKDKYKEVEKEDKNVRIVDLDEAKQKAAPATALTYSSKEVEVMQGDTLYSISRKYNTPLRDIIEENNLSAPYILKPGAKLTLPKSTYYEVKSGDTLYSISRAHQMNIDNIVALNDLKPPYQVNVGQKLKISASATYNEPAPKPITAPSVVSTPQMVVAKKEVEKEKPQTKRYIAPSENLFSDKTNHFSWPVSGKVISKFGPKSGGLYNDGINIKAGHGAPVKAAEDGAVAYVGNELKGYGNLIIVKHSGGWITAYAHLSKTNVKRGQKVTKSQIIAAVGSTGNVDSSQLYFGLRKGRDAVNPESYLRK